MHSGENPSHLSTLSNCKHPAWISMLFIFLMGFVFQGCVIHSNGHRSRAYVKPAPITFTFTNHHRRTAQNYYHRHPHHHHGKRHTWKKWNYRRKAHLHRNIRMQTAPLALIRQLPRAPRGTRYIFHNDQVLLVNVNTRRVVDFINIPMPAEHQDPRYQRPAPHQRVEKIPSYYEEEHPSSRGQGRRTNKGKPYIGKEHPSQHARSNQDHGPSRNKGKPLWGDDHPSAHAQMGQGNRGGSQQGNQGRNKGGYPKDHDRPSRGKGKTLWGDESPSTHAQMDKGNRGGSQQGDQDRHGGPPEDKGRPSRGKGKPSMENADDSGSQQMASRGKPDRGGSPKGNDRPSRGKGKPSMESADSSGSQQMSAKGKPDKGGPRGRGKQKNTFSDSSEQEDFSEQLSSHSKNKGKRSKQERNSARGPSDQEDREQLQPESTPEEDIQVAKVERGRGKGGFGKSKKMKRGKRGKRDQQTDRTAAVTQQKPAPTMAPLEPATTASFAPAVFDSNQRSIIQSYYQNSGSKRPGKGKGRGKSSKSSKRNKKRNKTSSVAKNDILTQPTESLPRSLESQLPPPPPNAKRALYNQQVVLIERGTNRVLDVINVNN